MTIKNYRDAYQAIREKKHVAFTKARHVSGRWLYSNQQKEHKFYVIWSYREDYPIWAYYEPCDQWYTHNLRYSQTTSRHKKQTAPVNPTNPIIILPSTYDLINLYCKGPVEFIAWKREQEEIASRNSIFATGVGVNTP